MLVGPWRPYVLQELRSKLRQWPNWEARGDLFQDVQEETEDLRLHQEEGWGDRRRHICPKHKEREGRSLQVKGPYYSGTYTTIMKGCKIFHFEFRSMMEILS